jgi:hypothetical protein
VLCCPSRMEVKSLRRAAKLLCARREIHASLLSPVRLMALCFTGDGVNFAISRSSI